MFSITYYKETESNRVLNSAATVYCFEETAVTISQC